MSDLHQLGVTASGSDNQAKIEAVDPQFIHETQLKAQKRTWEVLQTIRSQLQVGMTENDARLLALDIFKALGVTKHWHRSYVRLGPGTTLTFNDPIQPDYKLQANDPVYLDLGPVWPSSTLGVEGTLEYEGDAGDSFVFGVNVEATRCIETVRDLFVEARTQWIDGKLTGEGIYTFLKSRALDLGYDLVEHVDGHRMSDFPHQKYTKEKLSQLTFRPTEGLWILEVMIKHPTLPIGAFFEDLLLKS
jgi:hypothetical protein